MNKSENSRVRPLVSIVTPVYNGETYLAECIESVIAQTYDNWEYVIVNNFSTDSSLEIAQHYARQDERIRIHDNAEFLTLMRNWNHSLRQISSESKYCKVVHADDWLFPDCLTQMVDLAEENPTVGIVGSYRLQGERVAPRGMSYPNTVLPGREACRLYLLKGVRLFGAPTALLVRSDYIRSRDTFYNESNLHADAEACFEVLQYSDFGFVHQVLTFTRLHDESVSSSAEKIGTSRLGKLRLLKNYGPRNLDQDEFAWFLAETVDCYYKFLCESVFQWNRKEVWDYHSKGLKELGYPISLAKFAAAFSSFLIDRALNPKNTLEGILKKSQHVEQDLIRGS